MIKRNIKIKLSDLKTVLQEATKELKINQTKLSTAEDKNDGVEV